MDIEATGSMLFVKDFDRMVQFYEEQLGLKADLRASMDGWRKYNLGSGSFALHAIPPAFADHIEIADPAEVRQGAAFKPVFIVRDLAAACTELSGAGVSPLNPETTDLDARVDFADPEGNVFQLST
jgi:catechol 2,3-dioxygenase-like lactoylglutathione lyase family enzyme